MTEKNSQEENPKDENLPDKSEKISSTSKIKQYTRRAFLITGSAIVGGLAVGLAYLSTIDIDGLTGKVIDKDTVQLNAWVLIDEDNTITFAIPQAEMGQGVRTSLPMLIAEEMEVDLEKNKIKVIHPTKALSAYANFATILKKGPEDITGIMGWIKKKAIGAIPLIGTGASNSVYGSWHHLRMVGAIARILLIESGAKKWNVPVSECMAKEGFIVHRKTNQKLPYGQLAKLAIQRTPPSSPTLKTFKDFKVIGKSLPRLDIPDKVTGKAQFGIDVHFPGMVYASIRHSPVFGGTVQKINGSSIQGISGVLKIVNLQNAVAVIAKEFWIAKKAVLALDITFNEPSFNSMDSKKIHQEMSHLLDHGKGYIGFHQGDLTKETSNVVEGTYETPFLAHSCMEPINGTAIYRPKQGNLEVWAGHQSVVMMLRAAKKGAKMMGVSLAGEVVAHTTLLGGGFGRRGEGDVILQASALATQVPRKHVKLIWSREEDIQQDVYRPPAMSHFRITLNKKGYPKTWDNKLVCPSIFKSLAKRNMGGWGGGNGHKDKLSFAPATELPYCIPNIKVENIHYSTPVPLGFWRSVGHSHNGYFTESILDECALKAGKDPLEYRRSLLKGKKNYLDILDILEEKSQWQNKLPKGQGRGISLGFFAHSQVGQVVEVTVDKQNNLSIDRVICVAHVGTIIHPNNVKAQLEGAIIFGLSATLFGEITLENGRVKQSNFHDYKMVRFKESPKIEVYLVPSQEKPGGVGELGVPPIFAGVTNAIFQATGKRIRSLPVSKHGLV